MRLLIAVDVLLIGVLGMQMLARMKEAPAEVPPPKPVIRVEATKVLPEDVPVFISGFGEVRALKSVRVAAEVAGKIVKVHPKLLAGHFVAEGEILFEVDKRDYLSAYKDARATLSQIVNTTQRLQKELKITESRLQTMIRNRDLAKTEFDRVRQLYLKNQIGNQSQIDTAERSFNAVEDALAQMTQAVETYPLQIKEMQYRLESAKAGVFRASTNLRRCAVTAPFSGRLKEVSLEVGQYVTPGLGLLLLVDDTNLEINVPIDSFDARKWLQFKNRPGPGNKVWFSSLQQLPVSIQWTEDTTGHVWQGHLNRVTQYDKQTRTLTVVVRVTNMTTSNKKGILPLVEGMFCSVTIPGSKMSRVYRLPRWAVSFNNTVYLSEKGRLKTRPVSVARIQGDDVFVSGGLHPGDNVITTRLINPLENSLLEIVSQK
ncbi:biotin/lipoyl-binding protein [bacterium]|nr:biotin/lipoyl-binding protein [bacterium]